MTISPVGFVFIIIAILVITRKDRQVNMLVFCTVTDIFLEAGYFMKYGDAIVYFSDFTQKFFILFCLIAFVFKRFRLSPIYIWLNLCYIIPILFLVIFPSETLVADGVTGIWDDIILTKEASAEYPTITGNVLRYTNRFIFATFIALFVYESFEIDHFKRYLFKLNGIVNIFLLLGLVEIFVKVIINEGALWGTSLKYLFGYTESTYIYENRIRGDTVELALFTRESSHYVFSLLLCLFINIATNKWKGKTNVINAFTFLCIMIMLLSTSFSMILFLSAFLFVYLLYRWTILCPPTMKREITSLFLFIFFLSSSATFFLISNSDGFVIGRLINLTNQLDGLLNFSGTYDGSLGDSSTFIRIYSVIMTLNAFVSRPLFGISLGAAYCHGATAMLLSGIGIVGVYSLIRFYFFYVTVYKRFIIKKLSFISAIMVYLIVNLLNSLELKPFCNSTLIAVSICFCVIFSYKNKRLTNNKII